MTGKSTDCLSSVFNQGLGVFKFLLYNYKNSFKNAQSVSAGRIRKKVLLQQIY